MSKNVEELKREIKNKAEEDLKVVDENSKAYKKDEKDDNPDMGQYMGYGDLKIAYKYDDKHTFYSLLRYNPKHNRGAIQLNYIFPIKGKLKGLVQGFHGYGENLLDYNHKQTGIGVGLMFQGWDGL